MKTNLFPRRRDYALPATVSPKQLAARTKKSIANIKQQLDRLALAWDEVDNSVDGALDVLKDAFDEFERHINGSVEWLEEQIG